MLKCLFCCPKWVLQRSTLPQHDTSAVQQQLSAASNCWCWWTLACKLAAAGAVGLSCCCCCCFRCCSTVSCFLRCCSCCFNYAGCSSCCWLVFMSFVFNEFIWCAFLLACSLNRSLDDVLLLCIYYSNCFSVVLVHWSFPSLFGLFMFHIFGSALHQCYV